MGAGASAGEKVELQQSYAAWEQATTAGELADDAFLALLEKHAPGLHQKATADGTGPAAAKALRSQFETAKRKLQAKAQAEAEDQSSSAAAGEAATPPPQPPALQKLYSWAPDKGTNLARGLAANMLRSEPLRLVELHIAEQKISALLDTGAERCAMSAGAAARCGLQPLVDESFGGLAGGIGTAAKHGRVHYAKVHIKTQEARPTGDSAAAGATSDPPTEATGATKEGDKPTAAAPPLFEVAFDVMSWPPHVTFDAILGIDFLVRYKALIDVCGNTLRLVAPSGENLVAVLGLDGAPMP